jgi:hypothetical protein
VTRPATTLDFVSRRCGRPHNVRLSMALPSLNWIELSVEGGIIAVDADADADLTKSEPGIVKHCALPWAAMALTGLHS